MKNVLVLLAAIFSFAFCSTYHLGDQVPKRYKPASYADRHYPKQPSTNRRSNKKRKLQESDEEEASCSDTDADACLACMQQEGARYCKYSKAFDQYTCCPSDSTEGICGSTDPDVLCSDQIDSLLRYQVCYPDSLACGSSVLFLVNETLTTSTQDDFFDKDSLCYYTL
mmetsp:Transcript_29193/g.21728  ORF Transcript_29193/g.21728 Transcript_29193/m.21728 type:complete len:168 (-) Transcript_29193:484-987(-)